MSCDRWRKWLPPAPLPGPSASREGLKYFGTDGGSVINISSIASQTPMPTAVVYAASKGALDTATRVLAKELGPKKIRVNAINPGGVETEGAHDLGIVGSDFEKHMVSRTPLGRLGQPNDIASVAVFLASPASGWMTGETIAVGGGFSQGRAPCARASDKIARPPFMDPSWTLLGEAGEFSTGRARHKL